MKSREKKRSRSSQRPHQRPHGFSRRYALAAIALVLAGAAGIGWSFGLFGGSASNATEVVVYKDPSCVCCGKWERHLRANGFAVKTRSTENMASIKDRYGIKPELASCHTAIVEGYVIEGHVPAASILKLLKERPDARGLSAPGMPVSAPGMDIPGHEPFNVVIIYADGRSKVYATY